MKSDQITGTSNDVGSAATIGSTGCSPTTPMRIATPMSPTMASPPA